MNSFNPLRTGPSPGKGLFLIPFIFGMILGYFIWNIRIEPVQPADPVAWNAPWITHPDRSAVHIQFRKKLHLAASVRSAWIQVVAPDSFGLYVNGELVGSERTISENITQMFDLTSQLRSGENVIAVTTKKLSHPGPSRIALEGAYVDWQGRPHRIATDETWRASAYREKEVRGTPQWYQVDFDDHLWPKAVAVGRPGPADRSRLDFPPEIYSEPLRGEWAWDASATARQVFARVGFRLTERPKAVWVRVAALDSYSLFVNGIPVNQSDALIGETDAVTPEDVKLDMLNIGPFVHQGANLIAVAGYGNRTERRFLLDGLIVDKQGETEWFGTPSGWKSATAAVPGWYQPGFDDSHWKDLSLVLRVSDAGERYPVRQIVEAVPPEDDAFRQWVGEFLWILVAGCAVTGLAYGSAWAAARIRRGNPLVFLSAQRPAHLCAAMVLGLVFLIGYDVRFDPSFSYRMPFVWTSLAVWFVLAVGSFFGDETRPDQNIPGGAPSLPEEGTADGPGWKSRLVWTAMILVVAGGFLMRMHEIDYFELGGDESTMALLSDSTLRHGLPGISLSESLPFRFATTSEIIPYPMALSVFFFGLNDFAIRLPWVIFGTLTIVLLFYTSRKWFDEWTALLAAGVYAFLPFAIEMTHYARYPSQVQFFGLLTVYGFYRAVERKPVRLGALYGTVAAAYLTYLSWEGSAFLILGLLGGLLFLKKTDLSWLKEKHLWIASILFGLFVFFELSYRYVINKGIASLGTGVSQVVPTPLWSQPLYDPWVYMTNLLALENLQVISLMAGIGLLFFLRDRILGYLNVILIVVLFCMTNFLETQGARHVYYILPLLILSASRSLQILLKTVVPVGRRASAGGWRWACWMTRCGLVGLFLLTTGSYVLKLYHLPGTHTVGDIRLGQGEEGGVKKAMLMGKLDGGGSFKLVTYQPHVSYLYLRQADYYSENLLQIPVAVSQIESRPVHRLVGNPLIFSLQELKEVLNRNGTTRIIVPVGGGKLYSDDFLQFLDQETTVVYEDSTIRVHLWKQ
jgi:hypothetical protein